MRVLVDTSVWADYFRARPGLPRRTLDALSTLIEHDQVVTLMPIEAEVLSGRIVKAREAEVRGALGALEHVDLDWNARATWEAVVQLARSAQEDGLPILGVVDRMVLLATQRQQVSLWTLDASLARVATARGVAFRAAAG